MMYPTEKIIVICSPNFFVNCLPLFVFSFLVFLLGLFILIIEGIDDDARWMGFVFFVLSLLIILAGWLSCKFYKLTITDKRSILKKGFFVRSTLELLHEHIRSVSMRQNLLDIVFKTGTIEVSSSAFGKSEICIPNIANPQNIKDIIQSYQTQMSS